MTKHQNLGKSLEYSKYIGVSMVKKLIQLLAIVLLFEAPLRAMDKRENSSIQLTEVLAYVTPVQTCLSDWWLVPDGGTEDKGEIREIQRLTTAKNTDEGTSCEGFFEDWFLVPTAKEQSVFKNTRERGSKNSLVHDRIEELFNVF